LNVLDSFTLIHWFHVTCFVSSTILQFKEYTLGLLSLK
jgi:hypothetical protein